MDQAKDQRDFRHPYMPYDIQYEFMGAVYKCLEDGKVGIFESPTGTGKSLSLICATLTGLRNHKRRTCEKGFAIKAGESEKPTGIVEKAKKRRKQEALQPKQKLNAPIAKI